MEGNWSNLLIDPLSAVLPPPFPGLLQEEPLGSVDVVSPASDKEFNERLRDLVRALRGGSIYLLTKQRGLQPLASACKSNGLEMQACEAELSALADTLARELLSQSQTGRPAGNTGNMSCHAWLWEQCSCWVPPAARIHELDDPGLPLKLARCIADHIAVGPGIAVALDNAVPPALWQPRWVIICSVSEIRIVTLAFIGEPVMGDHPETKRTPFILQLTTPNLYVSPILNTPPHSEIVTTVDYMALHSKAVYMYEHLESVVDELLGFVAAGDWTERV